MAKKHLTKRELMKKIESVRKTVIASWYIPFSTMAVFHNYVLWKEHNWQQDVLVKYNGIIFKYYSDLLGEKVSLEELKEKVITELNNASYLSMDCEDVNSPESKSKFLNDMQKKVNEADKRIRENGKMYYVVHYNALRDMGIGREELNQNKKATDKWFHIFRDSNGPVMEKWKEELKNEVGIDIEVPDV